MINKDKNKAKNQINQGAKVFGNWIRNCSFFDCAPH